VFFVRIKLPTKYPFGRPQCHFLTPILHPSVNESGEFREDGILSNWNPGFWIETSKDCTSTTLSGRLTPPIVLLGILAVLDKPDWSSSCTPEVARLYTFDPIAFEAQCRILTQRHAQQSTPHETPYKGFNEVRCFLSKVFRRESDAKKALEFQKIGLLYYPLAFWRVLQAIVSSAWFCVFVFFVCTYLPLYLGELANDRAWSAKYQLEEKAIGERALWASSSGEYKFVT
jgi:ubiquitin-protein ligase